MIRKYNFIFLLFIVTLFFFTGCIFNFGGSETPNKEENNQNKKSGIVWVEEYPSLDSMKNLIFFADFDTFKPQGITGSGAAYGPDSSFKKWNNTSRAAGVLNDKHGNVCKLNAKNRESYVKFSVNKLEYASVLNFQMKSDMYYDDALRISVDNKTYKVPHKGYGDSWKKVSLGLKPGNHEIKFFIPRQEGYSSDLENAIFIDNITVVRDKIEFIEIYPKGLQEVAVGQSIKFTAVPLRGDRSVMDSYDYINYSVSGCGNIDHETGLFTPTTKGDCTVSVYIDGKSVQKTDVKVHGRNYLADPVTIGNYTFTGNVSSPSGSNLDVPGTVTFSYPESPMGENFNADGFFVLKGKTVCPLWIKVWKDGTNLETSYFIRNAGDFYKRIWLRFGPGDYIVEIYDTSSSLNIFNTGDPQYEGDIYQYGGHRIKTLRVKNTNSIDEYAATYLMPSEVVQSDNFRVSNIANAILAGLPANASNGDKLRAIHDWVLYNHHYDMVSVNHQEQRKRQDAEHVIKYGMGVCEGYANLYAALVRKAGIPASVIGCNELGHAWNQVKYNNNWYLVDVTWDDPVTDNSDSYNDKAPGRENYTYFMTSLTDNKHTYEGVAQTGRSIVEGEKIPEMKGMPDGWY